MPDEVERINISRQESGATIGQISKNTSTERILTQVGFVRREPLSRNRSSDTNEYWTLIYCMQEHPY